MIRNPGGRTGEGNAGEGHDEGKPEGAEQGDAGEQGVEGKTGEKKTGEKKTGEEQAASPVFIVGGPSAERGMAPYEAPRPDPIAAIQGHLESLVAQNGEENRLATAQAMLLELSIRLMGQMESPGGIQPDSVVQVNWLECAIKDWQAQGN